MSALRSPRASVRFLVGVLLLLYGLCAPAFAQDGVPCTAEPTVMPISFGSAITCAHQTASDTDVFTFAGATGEIIVVSAFGACMTLTSPSNAVVDMCTAGALRNRIDAELTESGTFTITTRVGAIAAASYTVALERAIPASPGARVLHYGETLTDQINVAGDIDLFSFAGGANDTVLIQTSTAVIMPPCIEVVSPDNARSTVCGLGANQQIQITLLQAGNYAVFVRQGDTIGFAGAWSYTVRLQCVAGACFTAPQPPAALTGTVSAFATTLTWAAPASGQPPTSYVVEAGTTSGSANVSTFDTLSTGTTFVAPGVPNGTYFVRVRSRNAVGTSAPSNEITITGPSGCALPTAPTGFTAAASGLVATLRWAAVTGSTAYVLEAGSSSGASNLGTFDMGLATELTTPAPAGTYFLRVRARNACGLGPPSVEQMLVVGCSGPPASPASLTVTVVGRLITLSWPAAGGQPSSYSVEAGSVSGSSNVANIDVGNTLTISANAPPGTYFVRVRARNACGVSGPTVEQTVVVP